MPEMNKVDIIIENEKYSVYTDENMEYIQKIEEIINKQIDYFKNSDKRFNSHTSLIFTTFLIADKYLKCINQLNDIEDRNKEEYEKRDEEKENLKFQYEELKKEINTVCEDKEKYLEELMIKNNETELLGNTVEKYKQMLDEKREELMQCKITIEELRRKNKEIEDILDIETSS